MCQQIWKTQQWPKDWKRSILIPIPKKGSTKEYSNHRTVALISHASIVMLKILHLGCSIMQTKDFQMSKPGLEKAEEPEIKLPTFTGSLRKLGNSRKTSTSVSLTMPKSFTVWITINCGKLLKWEWKWKSLSHVSLFATPWNSPGQNTGVGSHSLLQGIFPTQESNPGLPHCRWILYQLSYQGSLT